MKTNIFLDKVSPIIIAVDGESASGKGTLCKKLSSNFNLYYCQTSIFYRKLAYIALKERIVEPDTEILTQESIRDLINIAESPNVFDKIDETEIYSEVVTDITSKCAAVKEIRDSLIIQQKNILNNFSRVVMEGRDIGTVIAPHAIIKLFIVADLDKRAERRYLQYKKSGQEVNLDEIKHLLEKRDERDKTRENAPLKAASDAIIIDNSNLLAEEFYDNVIEEINLYLNQLSDIDNKT